MQPQLGGDRFHEAKVSTPSPPRPPRSRAPVSHSRRDRERSKRRERVSPLREPPLDGVHVHQLSVVVTSSAAARKEEWYSPCEIVLLFYSCPPVQHSVTDGRQGSERGGARWRFCWRTQTQEDFVSKWCKFQVGRMRIGGQVCTQ